MAQKKIAGLIKRGDVWYVDKRVHGRRIRESTGTGDLAKAEFFLARMVDEVREAKIYGVRPKRTFREAVVKYVLENQHKSSLDNDKSRIKKLDKFIGMLTLDAIHMGSLAPFIEARKQEGVKMRTINQGLKVVRRILNLATSEWVDENGLTWVLTAPKIKLLAEPDLRKPYPLSWQEQAKLFEALPLHLRRMSLFAVNTGCRDAEICSLKWEWEVKVPELNCSVFIIPGKHVKNRDDRLVVLNGTALKVIEEVRGQHPEYVFVYQGRRLSRMLSTGWREAREKANLKVRVHDLKHTFGRRLRAAGVSFEDRQDLLGHRSARITTHYSSAELRNLLDSANKVCIEQSNIPILTLLRVTERP
jgi:integrase